MFSDAFKTPIVVLILNSNVPHNIERLSQCIIIFYIGYVQTSMKKRPFAADIFIIEKKRLFEVKCGL